MGPIGSGKSTFIQAAIAQGDGPSVGHGLLPYTEDIQAFEYIHPADNRSVVFVDTPGFDEPRTSATEVLNMLAGWLKRNYKGNFDLAAIVYLHRISDNRMAGSLRTGFQTFGSLCGQDAMPNVILATTMWGEVKKRNIGEQREKELKENYWRDMLKDGCRLLRFNGTYDSAWEIVGGLAKEDKGKARPQTSRWGFLGKFFGR